MLLQLYAGSAPPCPTQGGQAAPHFFIIVKLILVGEVKGG